MTKPGCREAFIAAYLKIYGHKPPAIGMQMAGDVARYALWKAAWRIASKRGNR